MSLDLVSSDEDLFEKFKNLKTGRDIANLLEVSFSDLTYYLYRKPLISNYHVFRLSKKMGGERTVHAPITPLKILQRKLKIVLELVYSPKRCVHGFVQGKSILTNAQSHVRQGCVLNLDLSNFFPSINFGRVRGMFMAKPYNVAEKAATMLAQICCVEGILPLGAPTSPIVSNMICGKLDSELLRLARKFRCIYTRYADDITLSTTRSNISIQLGKLIIEDESTTVQVGDLLKTTIENNGFLINYAKFRILHRGSRQEVTGVIVNNSPNVKRTYIRQLRAIFHAIKKHNYESAESEFQTRYYHKQLHPDKNSPSLKKVVEGKLNYLRMIKGENDAIYRKLYNKYLECLGEPIKYITEPLDLSPFLWILYSEEDPYPQGSAFMLKGVGLITCNHVIQNGTKAFLHDNISEKMDFEIVASNSELDIAILKLPEGHYAALEKGNPEILSHGDKLILAGYPGYRLGDTPYITEGKVAGRRMVTAQKWILINAPIVAGTSGGPVLNKDGHVVGIAATGADSMENAYNTEHHGVIPITALSHLMK